MMDNGSNCRDFPASTIPIDQLSWFFKGEKSPVPSQSISKPALELLLQLLHIDPQLRVDAESALRHEWCQCPLTPTTPSVASHSLVDIHRGRDGNDSPHTHADEGSCNIESTVNTLQVLSVSGR